MIRGASRLGLYALLVLGVACATVQTPRPMESDATSAATHWPGMTLAQLEKGRGLYLSHCTGCHEPVAPQSIRAEEWPGHIEEMKERAHLRDAEAQLVMRFLVTMARSSRQRSHDRPLLGAAMGSR